MKHLYMFAIMPPAELAAEIHNERLLFAQKYHAYKALKPPVHITLYPPFDGNDGFGDRAEELRDWMARQDRISVELKDYSYFKNRRSPVVYIDIVENPGLDDLYHKFVKELARLMPTEESGNYKPHFTIGYRDVPPALFPEIKEEYSKRTFHGSFEIRSIFLWKHDRKQWQILKELPLRTV